jgi:hypothetical protein
MDEDIKQDQLTNEEITKLNHDTTQTLWTLTLSPPQSTQ